MKNSVNYVALLLISVIITACGKGNIKATTLPAPMAFELIYNGESMVTSFKDSVKVSYTQDGVLKFHDLYIVKLSKSDVDTSATKDYNGLVINDKSFMGNISSLDINPIRNFNIYLNGKNMGSIYLDYWKWQDDYPKNPSSYLTFNNVPVIWQQIYFYWPSGSPLTFLKVQ